MDRITTHLMQFWPYGLITLWGGMASYVRRWRDGQLSRFSVWEMAGEMLVSGFAGAMTYLLFKGIDGITPEMMAFLTGLSGWAGGRSILLLESILERQLKARTGKLP